jgi:hypothetical protein
MSRMMTVEESEANIDRRDHAVIVEEARRRDLLDESGDAIFAIQKHLLKLDDEVSILSKADRKELERILEEADWAVQREEDGIKEWLRMDDLAWDVSPCI